MRGDPCCKRLARLLILSLLIFLLILSGCKKDASDSGSENNDNTLSILTLDEIRSSGFLQHIIPGFEQNHNCKVDLNTVSDSAELMELIRDDQAIRKIDLVLGLNNCFLLEEDDYELFSSSTVLKNRSISRTYLFDDKQRVIPYGFGYLALIFSSELISQSPETFGELQDSRFLNQLAVCSPHASGLGRAAMFWTIALFGNDGFPQFWQSIKQNIHSVSDSYAEALNLLKTKQCGMLLGLTSTPAWQKENTSDAPPLSVSMLQEGSFLYLEGAAITAKAGSRKLAADFLNHLLAPESQKYVAFELGLFPVNESAPLPESFSIAPVTDHIVNDKLAQESPAAAISNWLETWSRMFSRSLY